MKLETHFSPALEGLLLYCKLLFYYHFLNSVLEMNYPIALLIGHLSNLL
jgi:hypothetical protein